MANGQTLVEKLNSVSLLGFLKQYKALPDYIIKNLNVRFTIREYQEEAIARLIYYLKDYPGKTPPIHLLFNMATGERVIIVTGCINVLVSRVSGTLTKYNSCIA